MSQRSTALNEVMNHIAISQTDLGKINHYYIMRNKLIHERATINISDGEVEDYKKVVSRVLKKLFNLRFPSQMPCQHHFADQIQHLSRYVSDNNAGNPRILSIATGIILIIHLLSMPYPRS